MNAINTADKRQALDAFAEAPPREQMQVMPMDSGGIDRVFGAQRVAVYRDEQRVLQKLTALGAAAGDDWFYRFPVNSKGGGKSFIEGASIKLANDLARIYGNCEVDTRVIDLGTSWLIYARFTDYESGFAMTRPFQQNKGASKMGGKGDEADARRLDIAFQIGVSKAIRNVTVNALQTYADFAFEAAKNSLVEKIGKDVQKWRSQMEVRLTDRGVDLQRVEYVIGRPVADWTAPDIAKVIAMMKAIADGMATIDETFPPKDKQTGHDAETGEVTEGTVAAEAGSTDVTEQKTEPESSASKDAAQPGASGPTAKGEGADVASSAPKATKQPTPAATPSPRTEKGEAADASASAAKPPTTEKEYEAYAIAWIDTFAGNKAAAEDRWKADKGFRNKANVSEEARDALLARLMARAAG